MHSRQPPNSLSLRLRLVALLSAGLVMLLSLAGASTGLHASLHDAMADGHRQDHPGMASRHISHDAGQSASTGSGHADDSHECAVTLFSQGVMPFAALAVAQPCEGILRAVNLRAFEQQALAQPRFLHLPPQAPPAA